MFDEPFANIQTARYIPAFLAVARQGSFTKAATALNISQPAVTMAIHQLESILNVRLFERTTRRVALTREGKYFVSAAERLVNALDVALKDMSESASSEPTDIRITAVHSVAEKILPAALLTLLSARPEVKIMLHDGTSRGVLRRVNNNEANFGFATASTEEPYLNLTPLFRDRVGVLAHADHEIFAHGGDVTWSALASFDCIRVIGDMPAAVINEIATLPENVRNPRYEVSYSTLLWMMLRESSRVSIVPALFAPNRETTGLDFRPLEEPAFWRTVNAVTAKGKPLTPVSNGILALIKDVVRNIAATNPLIEATQ